VDSGRNVLLGCQTNPWPLTNHAPVLAYIAAGRRGADSGWTVRTMKRTILAFIAGVVLASAATATAIGTSTIRIGAGDKVLFAGMECDTATTVSGSYFNCAGGGSRFKYGGSALSWPGEMWQMTEAA
jgi:hypothetical protein